MQENKSLDAAAQSATMFVMAVTSEHRKCSQNIKPIIQELGNQKKRHERRTLRVRARLDLETFVHTCLSGLSSFGQRSTHTKRAVKKSGRELFVSQTGLLKSK